MVTPVTDRAPVNDVLPLSATVRLEPVLIVSPPENVEVPEAASWLKEAVYPGATVRLPFRTVLPPLTVNVPGVETTRFPANVTVPATDNAPANVLVLALLDCTRALETVKEERVVTPVTARVEERAVAPVTLSGPPKVTRPVPVVNVEVPEITTF